MSISFTLRDSARIALAISAAFPLYSYAVPAGRVDFVIGNVTALATDGRSRPLVKGADINSGETITTGDGRIQLRFTDGAQVSLQPGTQYRIDDYRYNGTNDGQEKGFFSLIKGGFRTITGLVGKADKAAYKVNTSTATIGIRGTEYLVRDDNGINITTGEGSVEVCTSAGCIVLTSGESAVVKDKNGKPVRVINTGANTTNNKPATTPPVKLEYAKTDEGLASSVSQLPSGPGYAVAATGTGHFDGGENYYGDFLIQHPSGTATFNANSEPTAFVADGSEGCYSAPCTYKVVETAGGLTDGIVGWGRWTKGTGENYYYGTFTMSDVHYVGGKPTSDTDMLALSSNYMVGTYTLMGYTLPTATDYSNAIANNVPPTTVVGSGGMTGSLMANFGNHTVGLELNNIKVGGATYDVSGFGSIGHIHSSPSSPAGITGYINATGGSIASANSGGYGYFAGFFFGANAARAGLVYEFNDVNKVISGAAVFKNTSMAAGYVN